MVEKDATSNQYSWYRPVIASSDAGCVEHFSEIFEKAKAEAALAEGTFHREEVPIEAVKQHMRDELLNGEIFYTLKETQVLIE